jgi:hypothetical protein
MSFPPPVSPPGDVCDAGLALLRARGAAIHWCTLSTYGGQMRQLMTLALFGALAVTAHAGPIVQYLNGTFSYASFFTNGESFTTPSGGPWKSISFNFYSDIPATTPAAPGTAFLLSTAYAGNPAGLSSATSGFIASSTSNAGGIYTFDPAVTLQPNTQYWIFTNAPLRISGSTTDGTAAQTLYDSSGGAPFVSVTGQVANFTLSGLAVPEPSTWVLTTVALCGLAIFARATRRGRM